MPRPVRQPRGFTLIELMVVIGIIAVVAAAVTPALRGLTGADAREAAGRLAGSLRALFDTAAVRHATCRMVLDLEERAWWAECAEGRAAVARDPERAPSEAELASRFPDERDAERRRLLAGTRFGAYRDRLVPRQELPGSTRFGAVRVEGREREQDGGTAYVHFFPGGQAQAAVVPVVDGDAVYSVVVEPFTGRARVVRGEVPEP